MKKYKIVLIVIVSIVLVWNNLPYYYNNEKAADYATQNAEKASRVMCAWYVINAMWRGGCPMGSSLHMHTTRHYRKWGLKRSPWMPINLR